MSKAKRPVESDSPIENVKKQKVESTPESAPSKGIVETDVGITSYISQDLAGFTGTLKQRYTDFLVNEIDLQDNVVHFTDEGIPDKKQRRRERRENERDVQKEEEPKEEPKEFQLDAAHRIKLLENFGEEELSKIEEVLKNGSKFESSKVFNEKKTRGEIHQLFREAFQSKIETKTTDKNTFQFSLATRNSRAFKPKQQVDTRDENGVENYGLGPLKDFLHFKLYKENKDTMEAANLLSKFLRLQPKQIRYAGTKDRRGVTVQKLSISKIKVERVNSLNRTLRGLKLGSFSYENEGLSLGDLHGNEFLITLRDVQSLDPSQPIEEVISKSLESLKTHGFINYYGMQRFGTFSVSTHTIGKEILLGNWKAAAELILSDQEFVLPDSKEARKIWSESKDVSKALELMPRKCVAEYTILKYLSTEKKEDTGDYKDHSYFQAIMKIPRNLRIMYGHAYQSYIWNSIASLRVDKYGLKVVAGDLIVEEEAEKPVNTDESAETEIFEEDVRTDKYQRARPVTEEEAASGKFSIYDIVIPTPGFDINYPEIPDIKAGYKELMEKDGLNPDDMVRKVKEFSFAGSYRSLIGKAKNLDYQIRHYEEPAQQLVYTDLELLHKKQKGEEVEQVLPDQGGSRVAIILKFQLEVSAYATMALREVMKADTSRRSEMCDVKV
ncbi:hypothetical protein WICANDRAFT_78327 [Wickerhamomyces anomalus NRRL Y-366-8]|uniref:TRUD domain-containing protein n=1 Tax=Wickerhamomyces anomalus (strain ATCC 58044 / CBS 1984 / NCYC 433 / NRRL Y-366-8) TaxID=683960 RepID=A0A1E3P2Z4_WICAA|nr:uncharacterized protein WICANDRAFT_78327 [Wickerhamomyces anomalus NRRL Y-366-8]ODQ59688.1 hypothetical protein WICANDRAFT_78327 [Wickerhamomyces anomalus NRRL Y-366-8]